MATPTRAQHALLDLIAASHQGCGMSLRGHRAATVCALSDAGFIETWDAGSAPVARTRGPINARYTQTTYDLPDVRGRITDKGRAYLAQRKD